MSVVKVRESFMRQFVCEDGEEEVGVVGGAAGGPRVGDQSRRAFEYIGAAKIAFPYRKRCLVKTLVVAPPSQRPSSALRRHVVATIIEYVSGHLSCAFRIKSVAFIFCIFFAVFYFYKSYFFISGFYVKVINFKRFCYVFY